MSIDAFAWAWKETGLRPEQRIVLMAIADGHERPSLIAEKCELKVSQVMEILDFLVPRYAIAFSVGGEETSYRIEACRRRDYA